MRRIILTPLALIASPAAACSLCHTPTAVAVRASVLADLIPNLLALAAPAPVLALAVLLARRLVA